MLNIVLNYPSYEEEIGILKNTTGSSESSVNQVLSAPEIRKYQELVRSVPVTDNVFQYIVSLVQRTRPGTAEAHAVVNEFVSYGAGPRAGQFLVLGAKYHALSRGRFSPDIDDVKAVAYNVLRHRLVRNYKAEAEGVSNDDVVGRIM